MDILLKFDFGFPLKQTEHSICRAPLKAIIVIISKQQMKFRLLICTKSSNKYIFSLIMMTDDLQSHYLPEIFCVYLVVSI